MQMGIANMNFARLRPQTLRLDRRPDDIILDQTVIYPPPNPPL